MQLVELRQHESIGKSSYHSERNVKNSLKFRSNIFKYVSFKIYSILTLTDCGTSAKSFSLRIGKIQLRMPALWAANTFSFTPPTYI